MSYKILVAKNTIPEAMEYLNNLGYELEQLEQPKSNVWKKQLEDCDGFLMDSGIRCDEQILKSARKLQVIGKNSVGLDLIDVEAASRFGIWVTHVPGSNTRSTAEHTMAMLLGCAKKLVTMDRLTRLGQWPRQEMTTYDIYGKTLGIIGMGRIGTMVASMARDGFGMKIIGYDPMADPDIKKRYEMADSADQLLEQSDYVSLHVPLTKETKGIICRERLNKMKPEAYLINCARGELVDEQDLCEALRDGIIRGAAIDAYTKEPVDVDNPLLKQDNVILSPHNAAFTNETLVRMWMRAAMGIHQVLSGIQPEWPANEPSCPRSGVLYGK